MKHKHTRWAGALLAALLSAPGAGQETDAQDDASAASAAPGAPEEMIVLGVLYSAAQRLLAERQDDEVVSDVLGDEMISRLGDSTVAAALQRIPGLSLVNDKFVYVRGLGERYSSASLNGATIPSPDLTRNVIPLDIFPTSIVRSLNVQKAYSADVPAAFGGGTVDIRTKGIPAGFTYALEVGTGYNFENDGDALTYPGGGDDRFGVDDGGRALAAELKAGINRFVGNLDVQGILRGLRREGTVNPTVADARRVNRELALFLKRDLAVTEESTQPDMDAKASIGTSVEFGDHWEFGVLAGASYKSAWRETERLARNFNFPTERTDTKRESTFTVELAGNLNFGLRFADDHEISTTSLYLRNTDDETAIRDFFNENREVSDERGFRDYRLQFEQRDLTVHQVTGSHRWGATARTVPALAWLDFDWIAEDAEISWFYSEARARTEIPNQVSVVAKTATEPETGRVLTSSISIGTTADYRFTSLVDDVLNYGWSVDLPIRAGDHDFTASFGYEHARKARTYEQTQFSLNALSVADPAILQGSISDVLSDANILNPANDFVFDLSGTNNQSYIAATMTDAAYAKADWIWREAWRLSAGARWEHYQQVALDWNLYAFDVAEPAVTTDPDRLAQAVFQNDAIYPAVSLTWMSTWGGLGERFGLELFQLRFGWSETVVRPDLREITDASYVDPITDDLVDGNPGVSPSDVTNYDIRAEWFFDNGDLLTASLFQKDIVRPIEFFESAASDTTVAREIVNAESAQVVGVEVEGLKELGFLGTWAESFFAQANLTWQDSELVAGEEADAPTNQIRPLAGASEYVGNFVLGFDSANGRHTATLAYNVFGERLYVAGRLGAPDGYEQPFHSLNFTHSWYPTETITVKTKVGNILDQAVEIEREDIVVFTERPGRTMAVSFKWEY